MLAKAFADCLSSAQRHALIPQIIDYFHEYGAASEDGFLLSLFEQISDAENETHFIHYLEKLIIGSTSNILTLECAVSLCARHPGFWSSVLSMTSKSLGQFLACQEHAKNWMRRVLSETRGFGSVGHAQLAMDDTQVDRQTTAANARRYLHFVKTMLSARKELFPISSDLFLYSLALFDSDTEPIASVAKEVVFALLSSISKGHKQLTASITTGQDQVNPEEFSTLIWSRVREMNSDDSDMRAKRTGLQLRLRWTALPLPWRPSQVVLGQDEYWRSLQDGLRTGFAEQKKACLYILRLSVPMVEHDLSLDHMHFSKTIEAAFRTQYERLCVVYETLVISRAISQVEDCLHDLDFLASPTCLVHKSWLYALLEAALGPTTQDAIRNFTNRWSMKVERWSDQGYEELIHLLEVSYLPWATQGHLYTSSLVINDQICVCKHGESFANFLHKLLLNFCDNHNHEIARGIIRAILKFMVRKDHTLFAYAGVYVLHGLVRGLRDTKMTLEIGDRQAILKVADRNGLAEVSRDFYRCACHTILELSGLSHLSPQLAQHPLSSNTQGVSSPSSKVSTVSDWSKRWLIWETFSSWKLAESTDKLSALLHPSVENFVFIVLGSQYTCLRGKGLSIACDYLEDGLAQIRSQTSSRNLHIALEAIWNEIEIQDYPKHMLLRLPRLLLHETCLASIVKEDPESQDLYRFVQTVIFELQGLAENRIYVFSPLAKAIRMSILRHNELAEVFALREFLVNLSNRPPSPKLEFLLEAATAPLFEQLPGFARTVRYEDYYGYWDTYGYACIYDMLNRVIFSPDTAKSIFNELLDPWIHQRRDGRIMSKWKTTLQLQIMLLIVDQAIGSVSLEATEEGQQYFDKFLDILSVEPLPRYRFLVECIVLRILALNGRLHDVLLRSLKDHEPSNPKYVASLIKIAVMTARLDDSTSKYVEEVMTLLVTMAASTKVMIRHEAQWCFPFLWEHAAIRRMTSITENTVFAALNDYIRNLEKYLTPPPGRKIEPLDPVRDMTMYNMVQGPFLELHPIEREWARLADFELIFADDDQMANLTSPRIPLGTLRVHAYEGVDQVPSNSQSSKRMKDELPSVDIGKSMPIQTKGTATQANVLDDLSSSRDHTLSPSTSLVLIASLIKSPHNLGGLSRVAEIFGAAALHVASLTVLSNKEFLAVSVTSERHLNIQETPLETNKGDLATRDIEGLAETLLDLKENGYRVVGIEQTSESVLLGSDEAAKLLMMDSTEAVLGPEDDAGSHKGKRFEQSVDPRCTKRNEKVALVLGSEKEGIPAWILKECDACIEIPQIGVTRSLNVQTAAATVLYEYTRLNSVK